MRDYYEFCNQVKIISGVGTIEQKLGKVLTSLNCKRILIISGPVINKLGLTDYVANVIKKEGLKVCGFYIDVPNRSSFSTIKDICTIYRLNNCDSIVALGGGSVIDTAKAVKLVLSQNAEELDKLYGYDMTRKGKKTPLVLLPTTSGTGSEVTRISVISDENTGSKEEFVSNDLFADCCILDPEMVKTLPLKAVLLTAFDALAHAVEGYCCSQKNPISDRYSIFAIKGIADYLEKRLNDPQNDEYCLQLLEASNYAGISFNNSMVGAVHAIAHSLGAVLHVGHDLAVSWLLPYTLSYNTQYSKKYYAELFYYMVSEEEYAAVAPEDRAEAFVRSIYNLLKRLAEKIGGIPTLVECGLSKEKYDAIIAKSLTDGAILTGPHYMQKQDIVNILDMVMEDRL